MREVVANVRRNLREIRKERAEDKRVERFEREHRKHRLIFKAANGEGPWPCYCGCGKLTTVEWLEGVVHHIDGDHSNNVVENLAAMGWACHTAYHTRLRWTNPEYRAKMNSAVKAMWADPAHRERMAALATGRTHSAEARSKMSEIARNRSPEHLAKIGAAQRGKPKSPAARVNMSAAKKGRKLSLDHREKISAAHRAHPKPPRNLPRASCVYCQQEIAINWIDRHHRTCKGGSSCALSV